MGLYDADNDAGKKQQGDQQGARGRRQHRMRRCALRSAEGKAASEGRARAFAPACCLTPERGAGGCCELTCCCHLGG